MHAVNGLRNLDRKSRKEDVARIAFKKLEGLHVPCFWQKVCPHMSLKTATVRSTQAPIDVLTFHLDHPDIKDFVNQTAGMRQFRSFRARGLAHSPDILSHPHSRRCEDLGRTCGTDHDTTGHWPGILGLLERRKKFKYRSPWPKSKTLTGAPLWRTGDKGAPPSPQTMSVRKRFQRKAETPASVPTTQTQLSTGKMINVSNQDEQGTKYSLTACRVGDIEETPPASFQNFHYPLWVVNADLFVEYSCAGFVPKWLIDVMILGKDLNFHGETDVVYRIGRGMQRLWRI